MISAIARLLGLASVIACLIVAASFAVFVVQQTKTASGHQQAALNPNGTSPSTPSQPASREGSVHKALDEASNELTSPFAGIVSSSSEWTVRGVKLLFALLVYGFGVSFLARVLRVRA